MNKKSVIYIITVIVVSAAILLFYNNYKWKTYEGLSSGRVANQPEKTIQNGYRVIQINNENVIKVPFRSAQYSINDKYLICSENEEVKTDNLNQISIYDLYTNEKKILAHVKDNRIQIDEPQISNTWAVWVEWELARPTYYTIYKYNLLTKEKSVVKNSKEDSRNLALVRLALDGNMLLAVEGGQNPDFADVNIYNLDNNECKKLGESLISELPEINGNYVAWKGVDIEAKRLVIYLHDIKQEKTRVIKDIPKDVIWIQIDRDYVAVQTMSAISIYDLENLELIKNLCPADGIFGMDMEDGLICWSSLDRQLYLYYLPDDEKYLIENRKGLTSNLRNGTLYFTYEPDVGKGETPYCEVHLISDIKSLLGID